MLRDVDNLTVREILEWIKGAVKTESNVFGQGYQGCLYLHEGNGQRLILKSPPNGGLGGLVRRAMLRNERKAYSRLSEVRGVPRCYGLLHGRYLVLECVDGVPMRTAKIADREVFFETLLNLIKDLHRAGVAHGDLKKKDNVLVVQGQTPCVVDFGMAIVRKSGFAPLNHFLYDLARQFDFNAWVKLKYNKRYDNITYKDGKYYHRTFIEKVSRHVKKAYVKAKNGFITKKEKRRHF
jgi:predicted Ser/Thr protein kinase